MKTFEISKLKNFMHSLLNALGMTESNIATVVDIYIEITKRGVGHHDIHNFPGRIERMRTGEIAVNPKYQLLSSYGCMESWDGDNGLGELINTFLMQRAVCLARDHGIGFAAVCNSNKTDALMDSGKYADRSTELIERITARAPEIRIPGQRSYQKKLNLSVLLSLISQMNCSKSSINVPKLLILRA